jgi:hypothetical protein
MPQTLTRKEYYELLLEPEFLGECVHCGHIPTDRAKVIVNGLEKEVLYCPECKQTMRSRVD